MFRVPPTTLFNATVAGATMAKTVFPGTLNSCTLPSPMLGSGNIQVAPITITASGFAAGGVFAAPANCTAVTVDFACIGAADLTANVEFGQLFTSGAIAQPFASLAIKSITTAGTLANINPYTGEATAATTWRMFDLATITGGQNVKQLFANIGGTETDLPVQFQFDTSRATWYYIMCTNLSTITQLSCYITPYSSTVIPSATVS